MFRCRHHIRAFSITEYLVVIMIIMGAFFIFKDYLIRGLSGHWKNASDQFGYGRQYEPSDTVECAFDSVWTHKWYDETCVENKRCPVGNPSCEQQAVNQCLSAACNNEQVNP